MEVVATTGAPVVEFMLKDVTFWAQHNSKLKNLDRYSIHAAFSDRIDTIYRLRIATTLICHTDTILSPIDLSGITIR